MLCKEEVITVIFKCVEELNRQLPEESKLMLEKSTAIAGENIFLFLEPFFRPPSFL